MLEMEKICLKEGNATPGGSARSEEEIKRKDMYINKSKK
jgi:hypothetical protein